MARDEKQATTYVQHTTLVESVTLSDGIFLSAWKTVHVTVIHKSGLRNKVGNYRQVSLLSCVAKMMNKLMCLRPTTAFKGIISDR